MAQRLISLLHVEDDVMQRKLLEHHLAAMDEFRFDVQYAESEDAALAIFDGGGTECVVLDYQLCHGDGLNCLKELRRRDPIVPVIAVSGVATTEIASELLEAGADDYLSKANLTSARLAQCIRAALLRTSACRSRIAGSRSNPGGRERPGESRNGTAGR
jgi:DNA-binding response OmpR family regulator